MFKDPRTVDKTEGAVQAQWYSPGFMNAQDETILIQNESKVGEITYQPQGKALTRNSISYSKTKLKK